MSINTPDNLPLQETPVTKERQRPCFFGILLFDIDGTVLQTEAMFPFNQDLANVIYGIDFDKPIPYPIDRLTSGASPEEIADVFGKCIQERREQLGLPRLEIDPQEWLEHRDDAYYRTMKLLLLRDQLKVEPTPKLERDYLAGMAELVNITYGVKGEDSYLRLPSPMSLDKTEIRKLIKEQSLEQFRTQGLTVSDTDWEQWDMRFEWVQTRLSQLRELVPDAVKKGLQMIAAFEKQQGHQVPIGVATAGPRGRIRRSLEEAVHIELLEGEAFNIDTFFDSITTHTDIIELDGPEAYKGKLQVNQESLRRFNEQYGAGFAPENVIMFEDSSSGIVEAMKAGFRIIAVAPPDKISAFSKLKSEYQQKQVAAGKDANISYMEVYSIDKFDEAVRTGLMWLIKQTTATNKVWHRAV